MVTLRHIARAEDAMDARTNTRASCEELTQRPRTIHAGQPDAQRGNDADTKRGRDAGVDLAMTRKALEA
jgi:hypothetical protein